MGLINDQDIIRVTAKMEFAAIGDIQNVFYIKCDLSSGLDDGLFLDDVASFMDTAYTILEDDFADELKFTFIEAYNVTQDRPSGSTNWPVLVEGGDVTNQPMATQMAGQVNFPTAIKRSQGRKYVGGLTEAANTGGGGLDTNLRARLVLWGEEFTGGVVLDTGLGFFGHISSGVPSFRVWELVTAPALLATQRRRKLGTGS